MTSFARLASAVAAGAAMGVLASALPAARLEAQAPSAQTEQPTGFIVGQVIDAVSRQPVAGARVTITRVNIATDGAVTASGGAAPALPTVTATDGRFVMRALRPGPYILSATAPGYLQGASGRRHATGTSRPVEVDTRGGRADVTIPLWKFGVISGRVLDETGEPVVGARIDAFERSPSPGATTWSRRGVAYRTDDRGYFRLPLPPGDYILAVPVLTFTMSTSSFDDFAAATATGSRVEGLTERTTSIFQQTLPQRVAIRRTDAFTQIDLFDSGIIPAPLIGQRGAQSYVTTYYPSSFTTRGAAIISLAAGEDRSDVDIRMNPVPMTTVSGRVSSAEGPVSEATVSLREETGNRAAAGQLPPEIAVTLTDRDGAFDLAGVPAGRYVVTAERTGRGYAREVLNVGSDPIRNLDVPLRTLQVRGRVAFDELDHPGPEIGFFIWLATPEGSQIGQGAPPNKDWTFETGTHPPGRYTLYVRHTQGDEWRVATMTLDGRDVLSEPLDLSTSSIEDVVVTLTRRKMPTVRGVVTGDARAAEGAIVVVFPVDYRSRIERGLSRDLAPSTTASVSGEFWVELPRGGEYFVAALSADQPVPLTEATYRALETFAARVVVAPDGPSSVRVPVGRLR